MFPILSQNVLRGGEGGQKWTFLALRNIRMTLKL